MFLVKQFYSAVKQVLTRRKYIIFLLAFALFFFWLFVFIPVFTVPGNSLDFQLFLLQSKDYFLLGLLAFLVSLNLTINIYIWRRSKVFAVCTSAASSATSGIDAIFASVVGSATCASCLAGLFAALSLGFGSVLFVLKHQTEFLILAITLVAVSLYFTAMKVNR